MITSRPHAKLAQELMRCAVHLAKRGDYTDQFAAIRMAVIARHMDPACKMTRKFVDFVDLRGYPILIDHPDSGIVQETFDEAAAIGLKYVEGRPKPHNPQDEIWTTLEGVRIRVGDMDESHVRNALNMVIRRSKERKREALRERLRKSARENCCAYYGD